MSLKNYERPSLTTDIVVFRIRDMQSSNTRKNAYKRLEVLLIERSTEPQKGKWSLPGGFVNVDEEIGANALRKLKEKTGVIGNFYTEQLYTWGNIDRDERGRVISVSYMGLVKPETYSNSGGTEKQRWVDLEIALQEDLAFDHKEIIKYAVERLKGKMEYTDIVFNLLPDEFTIHDVKAIYELLFYKKQDNFRRRIEKYVEPLNKIKSVGQFRPAELYRWRFGKNLSDDKFS